MVEKALEFFNAAIHLRRDVKDLKVELVRMMDMVEAKDRQLKELEMRQERLEGIVDGFMKGLQK